MSPTEELTAAERVARDIDELDALEASVRRNRDARARVERLRRRRLEEAPSVRLSVAAAMLELSLPTIRSWISRGLLEDLPNVSPRQVTLESVLTLRPVLRELRELGQDRNLLEALMARTEDRQILASRRLSKSLEEMRRGEVIDITPGVSAA
jgi:hypothetical protein